MLSGLEYEFYTVLWLTGFLLNLGFSLIAGIGAFRRSRKDRALQYAGLFLLWLLLSAGFLTFAFFQELGRSHYGQEAVFLRWILIGYPVLALLYWLGQRRLRIR